MGAGWPVRAVRLETLFDYCRDHLEDIPAGSKLSADCFRDLEGLIWCGKVVPDCAAIRAAPADAARGR